MIFAPLLGFLAYPRYLHSLSPVSMSLEQLLPGVSRPLTGRALGVPEGTGWPEGDALIERFLADCRAQDVFAQLGVLEEHIRAMPMPSRFSTTRRPEIGLTGNIDADLSEAEFKRQCLLNHLTLVRGRLMSAFDAAAMLRLHVEVTGREM